MFYSRHQLEQIAYIF